MLRALKKIVRSLDNCDLFLAVDQSLSANGRSRATPANGTPVTSVSSVAAGEGKTWVTVSLALQASEVAAKRVLVVDAGRQGRRSATHLLSSSLPNQTADERGIVATHFERLQYMTAATLGAMPGDPGFGDRLTATLSLVRPDYDIVLIDGTSLSTGPSAYNLLRCADNLLLVIQHRRLGVPQIQSYVSRLQRLNVPVVGAVINKRKYEVPGFIYDRL